MKEHRVNSQFKHFVNQNDEVVAKDLAQASLTIATSVLDRSASPNLRFIMLNVDSTFDRLW